MKKIKKFLLAVIICVVTIFCFVGCSVHNQPAVATQTTSYDYLCPISYNDLIQNTIVHEGLTNTLPDIKAIIEESLAENDFLDWERFENVSEIREFKDTASAENFLGTTAFYAAGSKMVVVCPKFFAIQSGDQRVYIIAHELIHSLVGVGKNGEEESMHLFVEGITDFLSASVFEGTELDYVLTYQNELYCLSWLMAIYEPHDIVKMIHDGTILDFIDEAAGTDGIGLKLHSDLAVVDYSEDTEEVEVALLDEIAILSTLSGQNAEVKNYFTEAFEAAYAPYLD